MKARRFFLIFIFIELFSLSKSIGQTESELIISDSIVKIEMFLSVFGVEADDFPSINVTIDFINDTSFCVKSYFHPDYIGSTYSLTIDEMKKILEIVKITDLLKISKNYTSNISDQPTSTTTIYTTTKTIIFNDYGLQGEYPLKELYKIAYKY